MRTIFLLVIGLVTSQACAAGDVTYRPGGPQFAKAWHSFYDLADHEPDIDDPLIARGRPMVPLICSAVSHKDMKHRRYAIGALGYIGDRRALVALEAILKDRTEIDYFRGDALHSIYQIDRARGSGYALKYKYENSYLTMMSDAILKRAPWLLEPSEE